jgi:L-asparagine oxygenase
VITHSPTLTPQDNAAVAPLLAELVKTRATIEDPELVKRAPVLARRLPERLLEFLEDFRLREPSALCLVGGLDVDPERLGPTPEHWRDRQFGSPAFEQEIFFLLRASILGDVFGWATQQDGRITHDVLPIKGHEHYEIGSNSFSTCRGTPRTPSTRAVATTASLHHLEELRRRAC